MCKAFSCIVTRQGKVYWEVSTNSHDILISKFKVRDDTVDMEEIGHAKIEIIPDQNRRYPYLYPDSKWALKIDENVTPSWLLQMHKDKVWEAWNEWRRIVYQFNYQETLKPIHPFKISKHIPNKNDILLLKEWASVETSIWTSVKGSVGASVRNSVGDYVGDSIWASVWTSVGDSIGASVETSIWTSVKGSVGASVRNSVGDSIGAYIGSLFPNIKKWKYIKSKDNNYPYQSVVDLWKRGFVPSFDGKVWRLHSGKDASTVFEITKEKLREVK